MVRKISQNTHVEQSPSHQKTDKLKQKAQELTGVALPLLGSGAVPHFSKKVVDPSLTKKTGKTFQETDTTSATTHKYSAVKLPKEAKDIQMIAKTIL